MSDPPVKRTPIHVSMAGISLVKREQLPASSAIKSAKPMPIGARNVDLCFSAASMKMQKMSWKVKNISINRPRTTEVFRPNLVRTARGPGNKPDTRAAEAMAAMT